MNNNKKGSTFLVIIGVLAIIIFISGMFISSTMEESRHTKMSIEGLHAQCLAEAGLERAMRIITEKVNKYDEETMGAGNPYIKFRLPAEKASGLFSLTGNLGDDDGLKLPPVAQEVMVINKDELNGTSKELDQLVAYMTSEDGSMNGIDEYEITAECQIDKALKVGPGKTYPDFKVPGVDIEWNTRPDVTNFLNGDGYRALSIGFPKSLKWLDLSIEIGGNYIGIEIDIVKIIDGFFPNGISLFGQNYRIADLVTIDTVADILLNKIIAKGREPVYPITIDLAKVKMPSAVSQLWPSDVSVNESVDTYIEKYGQVKLKCEAAITYKSGHRARRCVHAVKNFKVADCEPVAPMYSFFISNLNNEYIQFNNYGGSFFVNNYDYSGIFGEIKKLFKKGNAPAAEQEKQEVPGLIRVNYLNKDEDSPKPIFCNVSFVGDWNATKVKGDDSGIMRNLLQGVEVPLIITGKNEMTIVEKGVEYSLNAQVTKRDPKSGEKVPIALKGPEKKGDPIVPIINKGDSIKDFGMQFDASRKKDEKEKLSAKALNYLKGFGDPTKLNIIPDVMKMSTNIVKLTLTLTLSPVIDAVNSARQNAADQIDNTALTAVNSGVDLKFKSCFQNWEWPYMGTGNDIFTLPTPGTGANKTHLFGHSGLSPTLTKEIEGNVVKTYRKWSMCIVGLKPVDVLYVPWPLPPVPIPMWNSKKVCTKYAYNLGPLMPMDENGNADNSVYSYDPELVCNMPPNLYTPEQYIKKAGYYYESYNDFIEDLPNRTTEIDGKEAFLLNGVTYIADSLGSQNKPFNEGKDFSVLGKGMIVCSGNIYLGGSVNVLDRSEKEKTIFSLISRKGALLCMEANKKVEVEGCVYTDKGIFCLAGSSIHIIGNWVTNQFSKGAMGGTVAVDYVSSRLRSSLGSLHPTRGKFDPKRYFVSFSPAWESWRVE